MLSIGECITVLMAFPTSASPTTNPLGPLDLNFLLNLDLYSRSTSTRWPAVCPLPRCRNISSQRAPPNLSPSLFIASFLEALSRIDCIHLGLDRLQAPSKNIHILSLPCISTFYRLFEIADTLDESIRVSSMHLRLDIQTRCLDLKLMDAFLCHACPVFYLFHL